MKSKRYFTSIVALLNMLFASAQCDTVGVINPWYLNNGRPDTIVLTDTVQFNTISMTNMGSSVLPFASDTGVWVYGVAMPITVVMGNCQYIGYSDTTFYAVLYQGDKSTPGQYMLVDSMRCDFRTGAVERPLKIATFDFACEVPDTHFYCPVYEIYFEQPHWFFPGDSIFAGKYLYHYGYAHPWVRFFWFYDGDNTAFIMQRSHNTLTAGPISFVRYAMRGYGINMVGCYFPIVGLRCTEPRRWRVDSTDDGTAAFAWQRHDDAEGWELLVVDRHGTEADSVVYVADSAGQTSFALPEVLPGHDYDVRLRKLCRYATTGYDTIVRSGWTEPLTVSGGVERIGTVDGIPFRLGLSPNPAREEVEVRIKGMTDEGRLAVSDMAGREVLSRTVPAGTESLTLRLHGLRPGSYVVTLTAPSGKAVRKLVVR